MVTENPRPDAEPYVVPPEEFAAQLDYLREEGYTTITPQDYARARKGKQELPEKPVILSFDDGYEDNYTNAYPILKKYNLKATIFIVTGFVSKRKGYL